MWLFVGLGNPGKEYEKNRHNVGFMAIDEIASRFCNAPFRSKFSGMIAEGRVANEKVVFLKPQTYMNLSGNSVQQAAHFYKIEPENIVVFYDELDLSPGQVKVKKGGGSGGHNGIKSMDKCLATPEYWRVRIGIGHPGDKRRVSGYVLSDFAKADYEWLDDLIPALGKEVDKIVSEGAQGFTNSLALRYKR
jgi:PTH1 family peptidyl-tRNA hydrolase